MHSGKEYIFMYKNKTNWTTRCDPFRLAPLAILVLWSNSIHERRTFILDVIDLNEKFSGDN